MSNLEKLDIFEFLSIIIPIISFLFITISILYLILFKNSKRKNKLNFKLTSAIEAERKRISLDLHDSGRSLISEIKSDIKNIKSLPNSVDYINNFDKINQKLDDFNSIFTDTIENIYPIQILHNKWQKSIYELLEKFNNNNRTILIDSMLPDDIIITENKSIQLYRLIQELTTNITTHSNPNQIVFQLYIENEYINIIIEYYSSASISKSNKLGRGSISIQNRLNILNGHISYEQYNTTSTTSIRFPINNV